MKKTLALFLALVMMASFLVGCSAGGTGGSGDSDTIKVGLNYELSGNNASYGTDLATGVEMALNEINENGGLLGKEIEIIKMDNKSDSTEAANVATRLITREM